MTREYMDEQYLQILQEKKDEDIQQGAERVLTEEIATQDIAGGQATVYGQVVKFASRPLLDGKISITMPEEWHEMELELVKIKYPYESRPSLVMTDDTTAINFTVNHIPQALKPDQLTMFMNTMKNFMSKMTKAQFIEDGLLEAEEKVMGKSWFDFVVPGIDDELYNLMFFMSLDQRALVMTFNCLKQDQIRWKPIVFDMLKTFKIGSSENTKPIRRMVW